MDLNNALIKAYGTQIADDIETIKAKFAIVVTAHLYAGPFPDNSLYTLNELLESMLIE